MPKAPGVTPIKYDVPYYGQWESRELIINIAFDKALASSDPQWQKSGAINPEEYTFWSQRCCGPACLKMALRFWTGEGYPLVTLAKECVSAGAFIVDGDSVVGLIWQPFVDYVNKRYPIRARSCRELPLDDLCQLVSNGHLFMASVHKSIRTPEVDPPQRGGHLVLVVGVEADGLLIHNPSGHTVQAQEFAKVSFADFDRFYSQGGIALSASNGM